MRIVCPGCAAAYEVPANRLTRRRAVRCARCGGEWVAVQEMEETPPPPEPAVIGAKPQTEPHAALPAITAMDRLAAPRHGQARSAVLVAAWVLTFGVLGGAAGAVLTWREAVVHAWPPSARILGGPGHLLANGTPASGATARE